MRDVRSNITQTPIVSDRKIIDREDESIREIIISNHFFHLNIENLDDIVLIVDVELNGSEEDSFNRIEIQPRQSVDILNINILSAQECIIKIYYMYYEEADEFLYIDPDDITDPLMMLEYLRTGSLFHVINSGMFIQGDHSQSKYIPDYSSDKPCDDIQIFHHETLIVKYQ